MQLISLQNADGSWYLDENLAGILGKSLEDLLAAVPIKVRFREEKGGFFEGLGSVGFVVNHDSSEKGG